MNEVLATVSQQQKSRIQYFPAKTQTSFGLTTAHLFHGHGGDLCGSYVALCQTKRDVASVQHTTPDENPCVCVCVDFHLVKCTKFTRLRAVHVHTSFSCFTSIGYSQIFYFLANVIEPQRRRRPRRCAKWLLNKKEKEKTISNLEFLRPRPVINYSQTVKKNDI